MILPFVMLCHKARGLNYQYLDLSGYQLMKLEKGGRMLGAFSFLCKSELLTAHLKKWTLQYHVFPCNNPLNFVCVQIPVTLFALLFFYI
jgi:hypothetical protein